MNDLELLRAYEPILRYTQGELFFPTAVEPYIAECDLWVGRSERERRLLVPYGELTTDRLAEFTPPPDETLSLRLVQRPLGGPDLARWSRRPNRPQFHASARLARVGLFARLVDAGFTTSLLVRGSVPGGTAAGASIKYEQARERDPRHVYHGRVVRGGGWIVLHYMYFYFMNDWRSTFSGANDHEADLEQAFVYLDDAPDGPHPVWFGCAAHDYHGDDLRRRWDDPALVKVGVPEYAAHMFIFYYSVLSEVSPPTALSPFAAAALTGGNPFKTMMLSWKYTLPAFIVPFAFAVSAQGDGILLKGQFSTILWMTLVTLVGIGALAGAVGGWLLGTMRTWERLVLLAIGLTLYFAPSYHYGLVALLLMAAITGHKWMTLRQERLIYAKGG